MMLNLYAIYDVKAKYYADPFSARTDEEAVRMFEHTARDMTTKIGTHPEDFILYGIGTFDVDTGDLCPGKHEMLGKAVEFVKRSGIYADLSGFGNGYDEDIAKRMAKEISDEGAA